MNAQIDNWNELRAACQVAKFGTLSAAAEAMDVHHSTVLRQVTSLERKLNTRLFHRHARGYAPTDAGAALFRVTLATEDQFEQLARRIANEDRKVSGRLRITTIPGMSSLLAPVLAGFQAVHPDTTIELVADDRLLNLEYGEAHVGIRAGPQPREPDNVVQHLVSAAATLYAHKDYVARHGPLKNMAEIGEHRFVSTIRTSERIAPVRWMHTSLPDTSIAFRGTDLTAVGDAVGAGMGIGPLICWAAAGNRDIVPMIPPPKDWIADLWLVTHVDLHRSAKVQAFLAHCKQAVAPIREFIDGQSATRLFFRNQPGG